MVCALRRDAVQVLGGWPDVHLHRDCCRTGLRRQRQTDSAIASYLNTTVPAIERMKLVIGQPEAVHAAAFAGMGLPETVCDAAAVDAIYAERSSPRALRTSAGPLSPGCREMKSPLAAR